MFRRHAASACLLGLALLTPLPDQEPVEIHNWSAPPFWSAPVKWEKGADAEPLSVEGIGTQALPFVAIPPCRIADTRGNGFTGQAGPPIVLANVVRTFQVTGTVPGVTTQCSIDTAALAVSFQFTVTNMTSGGNLIAWPSGPPPTTSVLNWNASSVAIGSGTVVQVSVTGGLNVQINAPLGQAADLIIDVNGFYPAGGMDGLYVNESQANSVSSAMITNGTIVDADISASAAIADTKLATIATAGKVADTALSANVTKLGPTIEASEITNITRSVPIPLTSFFDCQTDSGAFLDFSSAVDPIADLQGFTSDGTPVLLTFDAVPGSEDQDSEICSQFIVPPDYVSGGEFRVRVNASAAILPLEVLNCSAGRNFGAHGADGTVPISFDNFYTCTPTLVGLAAGDLVDFYFKITSSGAMNDNVNLSGVEFRYVASQ